MSEQRFTVKSIKNNHYQIAENDLKMLSNEVVDYMNLSSDAIGSLQKKVVEQQATIKKLQDLCGESDGENAKLRIENKKLQEEIKLLKPTNIEQYEQIVQLQKENEKLRKELGDCEKFRYQVFKRMNEEYIKECSIR